MAEGKQAFDVTLLAHVRQAGESGGFRPRLMIVDSVAGELTTHVIDRAIDQLKGEGLDVNSVHFIHAERKQEAA